VRRFMVAMLAAGSALSTPLAAQNAWTAGFAGTVGGGWQVEAVDVGYMVRVHSEPIHWLAAGVRAGSFVDQTAIIGGARGFVGALFLQARSALLRLADVGSQMNPGAFGVDLTLEAVGYAGSNSPLPQGSPWAAVSILPGLRFGDDQSARYGLVLGPTVFIGRVTNVHAFIGLRFDFPLAYHRSHP
jgi:hypothetical protein